MKIAELKHELDVLNGQIKKILKDTGYAKWEDTTEVECDAGNPDEVMMVTELDRCVLGLSRVSERLDYLNRPVVEEGELHKNWNGRYELNGYELTSGSRIEVRVYDEFWERFMWVRGRIEHRGEDYYFTDWDVELEGCKARIRR